MEPRLAAALALLAAWVVILLRTGLLAEDEDAPGPPPARWPSVVAIVPARDEAALIARTMTALLAQDYTGPFRIILVDDGSTDGTGEIARALSASSISPLPPPEGEEEPSSPSGGGARRAEGASPPGPALTVLTAPSLAPGWTGKLAAVAYAITHADEPKWLWLTDADIAHTPDTLRALVARAERDHLVLNSRMALLRTRTFAERTIVPAFVYFFRLLYPFKAVNNPNSPIAAAAGGCMLIEGTALARAGGVAAIRGALIDDVAMGHLMKRQGSIRLALSHATRSLRGSNWAGLWSMIVRSAYAQLDFSPLLLVGAISGIMMLFWGPVVLGVLGYGRWAWFIIAMASFGPMLRFYRQSLLWALALPLIALFYAAATLASAVQHWRGRGGMWKGRAQAMARA